MDIKPVKTAADYESTLAEINSLWGAEPDTPDGDRLGYLCPTRQGLLGTGDDLRRD